MMINTYGKYKNIKIQFVDCSYMVGNGGALRCSFITSKYPLKNLYKKIRIIYIQHRKKLSKLELFANS